MKRIFSILLLISLAICGAGAKKMSDLKIYINPGHGGYTSNDRPIQIYPFEQNDTLGYWESKSNLYKGLHMYHILDSLGTKAYLSRIKNTEDDDRSLSGIASEANSLGVDLFFSIHTNAGESVNYPLMLYREQTKGVPRYPENIDLSKLLWKNLHSSKLPHWTRNTEYVMGDLTFYDGIYKTGLGVLRPLYVVGLLSEGSMHEHRPEAYRLMNDDYWWLEAWHFVRTIMEYFNTTDRFVTGNIAGVVYDNHNLREKDMDARFSQFGRDRLAPINQAKLELIDAEGNLVRTRYTDNMYNGVFVMRNVQPGQYTLRVSHPDYHPESYSVEVVANEVTYQDAAMIMDRPMPLAITSFSPNTGDSTEDLVSCSSSIDIEFNTDVDNESFERAFSISPAVDGYFVYSNSYNKVSFVPELSLNKDTRYTVTVTTEARTPDTLSPNPNLTEDFTFSFTTKGRDRLSLIDMFPRDGGTIHYQSPTIEFRFDNKISLSGNYDVISITDSNGQAIGVNKRTSKFNQLSNNFGNAMYVLQSSLTPGESYTATLSTELRDNEQLPLAEPVTVQFTASDETQGHDDALEVVETFDGSDVAFAYISDETSGIGNTLPSATRTTSYKLIGSAAARLGYTFNVNHDGYITWEYLGEKHAVENGDVVALYVQGDFNNHDLMLGFTSGTDTKYAKLCSLDFLGWKYCETTLDMLEPGYTYNFSHVKLVQVSSPITQKGSFSLDDLAVRHTESGGIDNIVSDNASSQLVYSAWHDAGSSVVHISASSLVDKYELISTMGAVVASAPGSATSIATGHLSAGVYLLKATGTNSSCQIIKLAIK